MPTCRDLMCTEVRTILVTATAQEAARAMREHNLGFLPVCEGSSGRLVGVITDRDLATRLAADDLPASRTLVSQLWTTGPIFCFPDSDVQSVEDTMVQQRVARLVVVDADGRPIGIVSLHSILRAGRRWARKRRSHPALGMQG